MTNENSNDNKTKKAEDDLYMGENSTLQTREEHDEDKDNHSVDNEKVAPIILDDSPTLADKITINPANEDILTPVVDDDKTGGEEKDDQ